MLTNNHVLPGPGSFALLPNSARYFFASSTSTESRDIAIFRLLDVNDAMTIVPIGRSADLMNGETVVVAGNPGGRGTVFTSGNRQFEVSA